MQCFERELPIAQSEWWKHWATSSESIDVKTLLGIHDEATYNLGQMTGNCQSLWYELNVSKKKKNKRLHIFVKGLAILFGLQKEI